MRQKYYPRSSNIKTTMNVSEPLASFECKRCDKFSTDGFLSIAEQHHQMKEHLESVHPYWDFEDLGTAAQDYRANFRRLRSEQLEYFCTKCRTIITSNTPVCTSCGADTTEFTESSDETDQLGRTGIDRKQLFGILGSILLFFGVFTPIISVPIVGSVNYFQNGKGDGVIILVLALISIGLVLVKKYGGLYITGAGSLAVMVFTFVNFQVRMSQIQDEMQRDLAGNPFRGIADVAMQSVQMQWGWAVLVIGAVLVIAAAAISDKAD